MPFFVVYREHDEEVVKKPGKSLNTIYYNVCYEVATLSTQQITKSYTENTTKSEWRALLWVEHRNCVQRVHLLIFSVSHVVIKCSTNYEFTTEHSGVVWCHERRDEMSKMGRHSAELLRSDDKLCEIWKCWIYLDLLRSMFGYQFPTPQISSLNIPQFWVDSRVTWPFSLLVSSPLFHLFIYNSHPSQWRLQSVNQWWMLSTSQWIHQRVSVWWCSAWRNCELNKYCFKSSIKCRAVCCRMGRRTKRERRNALGWKWWKNRQLRVYERIH